MVNMIRKSSNECVFVSNLKEWCSIHVRRGDYLNYPDHHPVCSLEYFYEAMKMSGFKKFVVLSDDIEWCFRNFHSFSDFEFIYSRNESDIEDFAIMSKCAHNIISNSTFSWWAAYLNKNPDKIVISPDKDQWHGPAYSHWNHDDLIPESWIQLKY
jgi:hypothetical protein